MLHLLQELNSASSVAYQIVLVPESAHMVFLKNNTMLLFISNRVAVLFAMKLRVSMSITIIGPARSEGYFASDVIAPWA